MFRFFVIAGLCFLAIAVITPFVLKSLGYDVKVQWCLNDTIPCGWLSYLSKTTPER
jgi:hypothetical protein